MTFRYWLLELSSHSLTPNKGQEPYQSYINRVGNPFFISILNTSSAKKKMKKAIHLKYPVPRRMNRWTDRRMTNRKSVTRKTFSDETNNKFKFDMKPSPPLPCHPSSAISSFAAASTSTWWVVVGELDGVSWYYIRQSDWTFIIRSTSLFIWYPNYSHRSPPQSKSLRSIDMPTIRTVNNK